MNFTKSDTDVTEGAAGDGHVHGKFSVAKGREERAEASNGVGKNNRRASVQAASGAGGDKDSSTNHTAEAKPDEVVPTKGPLQVSSRASSGLAGLFK